MVSREGRAQGFPERTLSLHVGFSSRWDGTVNRVLGILGGTGVALKAAGCQSTHADFVCDQRQTLDFFRSFCIPLPRQEGFAEMSTGKSEMKAHPLILQGMGKPRWQAEAHLIQG